MCSGDDHNCPEFELHRKKLLDDLDHERRSFLKSAFVAGGGAAADQRRRPDYLAHESQGRHKEGDGRARGRTIITRPPLFGRARGRPARPVDAYPQAARENVTSINKRLVPLAAVVVPLETRRQCERAYFIGVSVASEPSSCRRLR
jgi:hypothetical protein